MSGKVRITPYGGLGEIGMNCMLIETDTTGILIDCGLMFSELEHFGVEFVIPNFAHLLTKKDKIKAIFATHGHEDHIGALPFLIRAGVRAPIYSSHFTSLMIRERLKESGLSEAVELKILHSGGHVQVGNMKISTASVNHSIIDAFALFIETPIGKIIHTGDFKLGSSAYFGDVMEWQRFQKAGEDGVLLLLSDSTNVENTLSPNQEESIVPCMEELFERAEGLVIVTMFSSNVGRIANLFKLAQKMGKKIALTGRSMEQNIRLANERGAVNLDSSVVIPLEDVNLFPRNKVVVLSTGCQGEARSALNRMAHGEHGVIKLQQEDMIIFSSSQIPGNENSISRLINELFKSGPEVIYNAVETVHSSGHATRGELKKVLEVIRPKFFVPIHGEYRHLVHHAELAMETGVNEDNVAVIENGQAFELTQHSLKVVEEIAELKVLVENREGQEITKSLLKDRRRLAESGVVFCLITREKDSGRILSKPQVIAKGLIAENFELWLLEEAGKAVQEIIGEYTQDVKRGYINPDFAEEVRVGLRRFFDRNIGRKPTVVPLVMDV